MSVSSWPRWLISLAALLVPTGASISAAESEPTAAEREFFEKEVRPLLVSSCFKCHSAREKQRGGLLLDHREALLTGGDNGPVLVPGKPDESRLIEAIRYTNSDLKMPPKGKLKDEEIAVLTKWVKQGAFWPNSPAAAPPAGEPGNFNLAERGQYWSFQPIRKEVAPPAVRQADWPRGPVDRFILAGLEAQGLAPAAAADKATLLRRVTFDLIGLPPTPAELAAFLGDESPQAFETVVDRLLDSPHYGERWARHWLDLVRFAETLGHEFDFELPYAFEYRDYVIRALNADVPYDQFVREQVAGDLLPQPRRHPTERFNESVIGTGGFWFGEGKHSPVDIRAEEASRLDNQIDVFAKTFLGLTLSCARCHDHKFDPLPTKDYYALTGFLQSSRFQNAFIDDPAPLETAIEQIQKIQAERTEILARLNGGMRLEQLTEMEKYLVAAREVLRNEQPAESPPATAAPTTPDVVFADFEKATYEGWTATGDAFGDGPNRLPLPEYQGNVGAVGKGLINSHSALKAGKRTVGDSLTGTLTSRKFKVERRTIQFLIGGGSHAGKTCINLYVDGKLRRTATGKNENRMSRAEFDVREFAGQEASLEIVDQETGGWGNIGIDEIVFTDAVRDDPAARALLAMAAKHKLDAQRLERWVRELTEQALPNPAHVLHPWAKLAQASPQEFVAARQKLGQHLETLAVASDRPEGTTVIAEFSGDDYGDWFVAGTAFGRGPLQSRGALGQILTARPEAPIAMAGIADSAVASPRLRGNLRSQTFTLEKPKLWYRMAGEGCKVNLIIDEFHLIQNPIYGGLSISPAHRDKFAWQEQDVSMWLGHRAYVEIVDDGDGFIAVDRIVTANGGPPPERPNAAITTLLADATITSPGELARHYQDLWRKSLQTWISGAEPPDRSEILGWILHENPCGSAQETLARGTAAEQARLSELQQKQAQLEAALPVPRRAMALTDGTPENAHVLIRGNHKTPGEEVPRRFLEVLENDRRTDLPPGSGRLALAERMLDESNPLVARVMVNRLWKHHFGEGIVRSPDDFGLMGQLPTHPELLDFLAVQFRRDGWSLKKMHRLMLLTSTYQMSSHPTPAAVAADPQNRLLHHMPIRRLEAESIRDAILAVSGRLDRKLYGRSVLPYLTPFMLGRGRPSSGPLDGDGRRGIYINVRRNFLTPMFLAFDYPIPFTTIGRRSVSNVPAQALTMMNNPFVVQQAEHWSKRLLSEASATPAERVRQMYVTAFSRPPTEPELQVALEFLESQSTSYGAPQHPQAWADLAHVLMNTKEFIFLN